MSKRRPSRTDFPAWAAPWIGALLGWFLAFTLLLQNDPISPWPPLTTIAAGASLGLVAGLLLVLRERFRNK